MIHVKFFFLVAVSVIISDRIAAQDHGLERGSVYPGYIITLEGDTTKGYLLNINLWLNQHMTFFYKDPDDREGRVRYKAGEIRAYQVGDRFYESMKYTFSYSRNKQNFIMRKLQGPVDLYVWYYNQDMGKLMYTEISLADLVNAFLFDESDLWTSLHGMKETGEFTELTGAKFLMRFARNMSAYVEDDTDLARKILDKTPGYLGIDRDIEHIIHEYNERKQSAAGMLH